MKLIRRLYDWVLHWAETPSGPIALFILAFAEASFFPIPPDALLIALVLGSRTKAFKFATNCTIASVAGALLGYAIGHFLWWGTMVGDVKSFSAFANFFFNNIPGFTEQIFFETRELYDAWNFWIIFTAGFTPIPFKVFTISAGAFEINLLMFVLASLVSRGARFFLVATLIWKYGDTIKEFIDKYFDWLALAFTVLLVGGFVAIKYVF